MEWYKKIGIAGLAALTMSLASCSEFNSHKETVNENCEIKYIKNAIKYNNKLNELDNYHEDYLNQVKDKLEKFEKVISQNLISTKKACENSLKDLYVECKNELTKIILEECEHLID